MEILEYTFMQRAIIEAILVGGTCAIVGVYVVMNGLSFIGAGISHSTFGGVALGLFLGVDPTIGAFVFSTAVALSIGVISEKGYLKHDTVVGIFFAATMAFGILIISLLQGYYVDVFGYLFGNILSVTVSDILLSLIMAGITISIIILFFKEFLAISFDAEMAAVMGLPVRVLYYLLLIIMALTVVISVKSIGVVLVSALIVIPPAAAYQLTKGFTRMMLLSLVFGIGSSLMGLVFSYWLSIPSGASIVLTATVLFFITWALSTKKVYATARISQNLFTQK